MIISSLNRKTVTMPTALQEAIHEVLQYAANEDMEIALAALIQARYNLHMAFDNAYLNTLKQSWVAAIDNYMAQQARTYTLTTSLLTPATAEALDQII